MPVESKFESVCVETFGAADVELMNTRAADNWVCVGAHFYQGRIELFFRQPLDRSWPRFQYESIGIEPNIEALPLIELRHKSGWHFFGNASTPSVHFLYFRRAV